MYQRAGRKGRTSMRGFASVCGALLTLSANIGCTGSPALAQNEIPEGIQLPPEPGAEGAPDELRAWDLVRVGKLARARTAAERIAKKKPRSYIAHFVLGYVHHYAEGNFPRALFFLRKSLSLFEAKHGSKPTPNQPWRWHARLLKEIAAAHGDLDQYEKRLEFLAKYNAQYAPKAVAERAWPLMKLGKYNAARTALQEGLATSDEREIEIALNAKCAIEFEAGHDGASYRACREAVEYARAKGSKPTAVDLANFAEAARSLFKLDEAERVLLDATEAPVSWYGNPWLELAELYTRQARFAEALQALKKVPAYRAKRPPHVRDADRNEGRRALSAFFVAAGRPVEALRITGEAMVFPDRRAHTSRDPYQDRAVTTLLDRRANLLSAEFEREKACARSWWRRTVAYARSLKFRFLAWMSERQTVQTLSETDKLVGIFRVGTARSAITPPWLIGELVSTMGPTVVRNAIARARAQDERPGASAYYDAFATEAAWALGEYQTARKLGTRALSRLGPSDALLRARMHALLADSAYEEGSIRVALPHYEQALQKDPGVFRRLGLKLPVRIESTGDALSDELASAIRRSVRFDVSSGLLVRISPAQSSAQACLFGASGVRFACGTAPPKTNQSLDQLAQRIVDAFHKEVFAPRVELIQADLNSLDGTGAISRDPTSDGVLRR